MVRLNLHLPLRKKKSEFSLGGGTSSNHSNSRSTRYGGVGVAESTTDHAQHESSSFFRHHVRCTNNNSASFYNMNNGSSNHTSNGTNSDHQRRFQNLQEQFYQEDSFFGGTMMIDTSMGVSSMGILPQPSLSNLPSMGGVTNSNGRMRRSTHMLEEDKVDIVIPKASMESNVHEKMNQYYTEKLIHCQRRLTKLYGREQEIQILQQELDQLLVLEDPSASYDNLSSSELSSSHNSHHNHNSNTNGSYRSLIQICGQSGEGKTALALQLQGPAEKRGCFFVMGKFDLANIGQPYSGIKTALSQLIQEKILQGLAPAQWQQLRDEICQKLSWEIELLCQFIPELALLIPKHYTMQQQLKQQQSNQNITAEDIIMSATPPSSPGNNAAKRPAKSSLLVGIKSLKRTLSLPIAQSGKKRNSKSNSNQSSDSNNDKSNNLPTDQVSYANTNSVVGSGGGRSSLSYRQSTLSRNSNNTALSSQSYRNSVLSRNSNATANSINNNNLAGGARSSLLFRKSMTLPEREVVGTGDSSSSLQGNKECTPIREDEEEEHPNENQEQGSEEETIKPKQRLSLGYRLRRKSRSPKQQRQQQEQPPRRRSSEGAPPPVTRRGSTQSSTNSGSSSHSSGSSKRSSAGKRSSLFSKRDSIFNRSLSMPEISSGDNIMSHLQGSKEFVPIEEASEEGNQQQDKMTPYNSDNKRSKKNKKKTSNTKGDRISRKDRIRNRAGGMGPKTSSVRNSLMKGISFTSRRNSKGRRSSKGRRESGGGASNQDGGIKVSSTATLERMETIINMNANKEEGYTVGAAGADRLQFALRKLINVVSSFAPLILVFDDIQWADSASLDLLKGWITDEGNPKLITIWIYRQNIVGQDHCITKSINEIQELRTERNITTIRKIEVSQLRTDDITDMICDTLDCSDTKGEELSRILQQKTNGNVFFLRQYLQLLAQRGLLTHQMATMSWDWDLEAIRNRCSATENVVDLMKEKLEQSPAACMLLPLAACLGATFDTRVLQAILQGLKETKDLDIVLIFSTALGREVGDLLEEDGKELLGLIQMEGLIDVAGPTASFMHDRVMEGALALVKDGKLEDLKFGMGHLLLFQLENKQEQWVEEALFLVVDLLNCRIDLIPPTRQLDVCELNLLAGDKAHLAAAYSRSAIYYDAAIKLLPKDHWKMLYDASLHLYISAAEAEMCLAHYDKMGTYVDYVLDLDCPLLDKLPAYKVLIDAHMAKAELLETLELNEEVLKYLGFNFPKSGILTRTSVALTSMKMRKKRWKPEALAELPISSNPVHEAISQLHGIHLIAVMMAKPEAFPLAIIMACEHVLNHGLTRYSALSLAWLTVVIITAIGDYKWAKEHMEFTQSLLQRLPNRRIEARVNGIVAGIFVHHWTAPIHNSIRPLIASYSRGMETCDFESAFWCAHFYLESSLYSGRSLALLQKDVETYCKQEVDYGMMKHAECLQCLWQLILNLRGCSDNTILLTGAAHDEAAVLELINKSGDMHLFAHLQKDRLFAAAIFSEFEHGAKLGISSLDLICKALGGQHSTLIARFIVGLCCFQMARTKRKKKKYLKPAVTNLKVIKSWSDKGNPNARHYLTFLQAEKAVYEGKKDKAITLYERTILLSGRSGYNHDCALASERLAAFYLSLGDHSSAMDYYQDSITLYEEWGASKKVELMKARMPLQVAATP